jgi:hypothetical protein
MEEFISDITKLFIIKTCCYNKKNNIKKNIIIDVDDNKWKRKKYREINDIPKNEIKKICNDLENKMKFKRENNSNTPRRIPI